MAGGGGGAEASVVPEITLEYTPTWIVASVCSVIVVISLLFERMLHRLGKRLLKRSKKTQYEALLKIQKELMLLGFISLMLGVLQGATQKICVKESVMHHLLPCPLPSAGHAGAKYGATMFTGVLGGARRLLSGGSATDDYCLRKGKVPILSLEALHRLDMFIFNLAVTHVVLSLLTFVVGVAQSVDVVIGWYVYTWLPLAPFILLLVVGCKMEHVITELAVEVAKKHTAIEGDVIVAPSDDFFWLHRPKVVLYLIHFILFQIAFEIAFFFWLLAAYGYKSCIMGRHAHAIARLVLSVASRILCGYSTLPLYVIVSHMGSSFNKAIFDDNVSEDLVNWAQSARRRKGKNKTNNADVATSSTDERHGGSVQMTDA
ncbi:MLO-like protein 1 [Panicum virgatum]|uniref:MLO-like protein 1 n=1 Tax=Panicum virgatum TaxID=38727 RepID=UPI0019D59ED8|nr:MLO-like protein 1 [Panicum virgatum]